MPVMHTDLDLPEDQIYCPPITIRCVDCRSFGRFVLVGTHTINSLQRYMYKSKQKDQRGSIKSKTGMQGVKVNSWSRYFFVYAMYLFPRAIDGFATGGRWGQKIKK